MLEVGVSEELVKNGLLNLKVDKILPFRFITAARYVPRLESVLEQLMFKALGTTCKLEKKATLLVDVSGSMSSGISSRTEVTGVDVACGLAVLAREMFLDVKVFTFSGEVVEVPARRGFALRDAINSSQEHGSTYMGKALEEVSRKGFSDGLTIVITDEQSHDEIRVIPANTYVVNVSTNQNGVVYDKVVHIDGFSEATLNFILEYEKSKEVGYGS